LGGGWITNPAGLKLKKKIDNTTASDMDGPFALDNSYVEFGFQNLPLP
jgi:hypothetical protein